MPAGPWLWGPATSLLPSGYVHTALGGQVWKRCKEGRGGEETHILRRQRFSHLNFFRVSWYETQSGPVTKESTLPRELGHWESDRGKEEF